MDPSQLAAAIVTLLTMTLVVLNRKWDLGITPSDLVSFGAAATVVIIVWINYKNNKSQKAKAQSKIDQAECMVPGITTPTGPVAEKTVIVNNPASTQPPVVTTSKGP